MSRRKTLMSLGGTDDAEGASLADEGGAETFAAGPGETPVFEDGWEEEPHGAQRRWLMPALGVLAIVAWSGFFAWSHVPQFRVGVTPAQGSALVSDWAVPVVLVLGLWLLALRNSTREASRFGDTARMLASESQALERRLVSVNAELSLARDFIAAQSRDLESLGRMAAERLSTNAGQLQDLIRDNGAQVNAIGEVSDTALANMDKLRERLPVVANSARDLTSQIGHVGNTAQQHLGEMIAAFQRLNDFGEACGRQVDGLRQNVDATLTTLETHLGTLQGQQESFHARFAAAVDAMHDHMAQAIAEIARIDEAAIANAQRRVESLAEAERTVRDALAQSATEFETEHAQRNASMDASHRDALAALKDKIAAFDAAAAERQQEHLAHVETLARRGATLAAQLSEVDSEIARLAELGREQTEQLGEASRKFTANLTQGRDVLEDHKARLTLLTDGSVRLLELIRAGVDHSEGALTTAIGQADERLSGFADRVEALGAAMTEAEGKGAALQQHVAATGTGSTEMLATLATLEDRLTTLGEQAQTVAAKASADLEQSLATLDQAATALIAQMHAGQADAVRAIAERVGEEAGTLIGETIATSSAQAIADLQLATNEAAAHGRATAIQLRDQLAKVNQLAGNLEQRVAQARVQAEEQVNSDFTRRMALITESLNSCSIDIARALDAEVTDTAWAGYLKGDRGIFTRRAVRLLDNQEVRAISDAYDSDEELRAAVNRYIHDFEALLRPILSTRDGNAMGVTLLSSDIGKLYVVLAQAIERLRG
ncbi:MAG: hypothetical protein ABIT10_07910 [Alteraurantiacibacter sp.]